MPLTVRLLRLLTLLLLATATSAVLRTAAAQPVNFVVFLIDDMGWTDAGYAGSTFYETPHLDRLAREGMRFTNGYAASPVCSPTRASLMTGRYPARLRQTDWIPGRTDRPDQRLLQVEDLNYLPVEEITLAERLRQAGYVTAHIGKWHLGDTGFLPEDHGFDVNIAGTRYGSPPGYFFPYERGDNTLPNVTGGQEGEYLTDRLAEEAAQFIAAHRDQPFFLYLPHYAVHTPLQAKEDVTARYEAKAARLAVPEDSVFGMETGHRHRRVQNHAVYGAMVESMDDAVGRVVAALEANGLAERTVIVFTSDNGGLATSEGWPTTNLPLRAGKGWLYEGGIRVPFVVHWPGVTRPGSVSDAPVSSIDLMPTLLEIAGAPAGPGVDGVSLADHLRGGPPPARQALYWHYPHYSNQGGTPGGAIRLGDYKLIEFFEDGRVALFDLARDPGEQHDLTATMPGHAAALQQRLAGWRAGVQAQMPAPNPGYTGP